MKLEIFEPADKRWAELFNAMPSDQRDVFYSPGYAKLCQATIDSEHLVRCAGYVCDDGSPLLYPFVLRRTENFAAVPAAIGLFDSISLYGRGGIVGSASAAELARFHDELASYMQQTQVFCSFDRLHPVMGNDRLAPPTLVTRNVGGFVVVDLQPPEEAIEASFKSSVRKDIRKAQRNQVTCFSESSCDHLVDFLKIYYQTMERNSASEFYYFPEQFFTSLPQSLSGMFTFFYAKFREEIVACELVLHCQNYSHSFLGGTKKEALPLAANPLLKFEIFKEMKRSGCKYFLLGGGQAPNDGIFNFKKAYAPEGIYPSMIGGVVWQPDIYDRIKQEMIDSGLQVVPNRFQFYDIQ